MRDADYLNDAGAGVRKNRGHGPGPCQGVAPVPRARSHRVEGHHTALGRHLSCVGQ